MAKQILSEWCSHCETEVTIEWDIATQGWIFYCPSCGKKMFMCNMCKLQNCNDKECPAKKQAKLYKQLMKKMSDYTLTCEHEKFEEYYSLKSEYYEFLQQSIE